MFVSTASACALPHKLVRVEQTGHDFVQRVPRRPDRLAVFHAVNERFGKRRQITGVKTVRRERVLAFGKTGDDFIHALLESRVAGAGEHQRARGQIMSDAVSAQFAVRFFPAAVRFCVGRQTGVDAKISQQPVAIKAQQIISIAQHCVAKRTVKQPHLRQWKRLRLRSDHRRDFATRNGRRQNQDSQKGLTISIFFNAHKLFRQMFCFRIRKPSRS